LENEAKKSGNESKGVWKIIQKFGNKIFSTFDEIDILASLAKRISEIKKKDL
jgi:hypothetical protein